MSRRVAAFEQLERLLSFLETQIRYSAASIRDILVSAHRSGEYKALLFLEDVVQRLEEGEKPDDVWETAIDNRGGACGFTAADCHLLADFGHQLGKSDIEGQLAHCETYRHLFDNRLEAAREEFQSKGKLYIVLGILSGLGIALLLY